MKIQNNNEKWSAALLKYANKKVIPYAAVILYNKRDVILRQVDQLNVLFPTDRNSETKIKEAGLYSIARELERAAELLTLEL